MAVVATHTFLTLSSSLNKVCNSFMTQKKTKKSQWHYRKSHRMIAWCTIARLLEEKTFLRQRRMCSFLEVRFKMSSKWRFRFILREMRMRVILWKSLPIEILFRKQSLTISLDFNYLRFRPMVPNCYNFWKKALIFVLKNGFNKRYSSTAHVISVEKIILLWQLSTKTIQKIKKGIVASSQSSLLLLWHWYCYQSLATHQSFMSWCETGAIHVLSLTKSFT